MSSTLIKAGALALACASTVSATLKYTLAPGDTYEGGNFFEKFDFKDVADPTAGYVQYQSKQSAESNAFGAPLVKYENGQAYMGVDYKNQYDPNDVGRPSVRIESQKQYNYGLFVLDIAHMPENVCGTWPAFWTFNELDYPKWGEIDILENINEQTQTLETLHTTPTCSVAGNHFGLQELGQQTTYNCDDKATTGPFGTTQYQYQGCSAVNTSPNNYGKALNAAGGAVYAMEWTKDAISVWNFQPGNVPANLVAGTPDTSSWGLPQFTTAQGDCDIDGHFKDHKVVLDTTFCGSWAGLPEMWSQTSCYDKVKYPRCQDYVAAHPEAYAGAYWLFNSMKVYQKTEVVSSTSSSSSTSSTSSSSTSSTSVSTTSSTSASTTDSSVTTSSTGSTATTSPTDSTVITSPTVSSSSTGGPIYSNSSSSSTSAEMTTSTVYTTSVYTVTSCAPTVTNCPVGSVTTATISLYTTVCPVSSSGPGPKTTPPPKSTYTPPPPSSVPQTSTVVITKIHTITSCAAGVVNCPGRKSTEYLTTTACFTPEVKQPSNLPVFTYTTWIKGVNATMTVPVGSGHGGHAKGTAAVTKTTLSFNAGVPATATPVTPIVPVVEGGASGLKVGGVMALVAGVLAMLL